MNTPGFSKTKIEKNFKSIYDVTGMVSSVVCMVHCMLVPILFVLFPIYAKYFYLIENIEIVLFLFAISFASFSFIRGFIWHHHTKKIFFFLIIGVVIFLLNHIVLKKHEILLDIFGSSFFVIGHFYNWILCKNCSKCSSK